MYVLLCATKTTTPEHIVLQYLCLRVRGSQGPGAGGGTVGVTGAGEGAVAIAMEGRRMPERGVWEGERLRTLGVTLHADGETEAETVSSELLWTKLFTRTQRSKLDPHKQAG